MAEELMWSSNTCCESVVANNGDSEDEPPFVKMNVYSMAGDLVTSVRVTPDATLGQFVAKLKATGLDVAASKHHIVTGASTRWALCEEENLYIRFLQTVECRGLHIVDCTLVKEQ
jgi:hypothetical protein